MEKTQQLFILGVILIVFVGAIMIMARPSEPTTTKPIGNITENVTEAPVKEIVMTKMPFGTKLAEDANAKWGGTGILYPDRKVIADEGWIRNSFNVPVEAEVLNECYIFMKGNSALSTDNITYFLQGPKEYDANGGTVCTLDVKGRTEASQVNYCGELKLSIALDAMKQGYNLTEDNWRDFITCSASKPSDFCSAECDLLLDGLMSYSELVMETITENSTQ